MQARRGRRENVKREREGRMELMAEEEQSTTKTTAMGEKLSP
jgi:hypothetical protein